MRNKNNIEDFEIFKIVGKNIQKKRIEKNISIKELSEKTGIREKYLIRIEKGEAIGMSTEHLLK